MHHPPNRDVAPEQREYSGERDMAQFWAVATLDREPARSRAYLPGLLALAVLCTPFYWSAVDLPAMLWGLPAWVWAVFGCSAAASCLTAWATIARWDDREMSPRNDS